MQSDTLTPDKFIFKVSSILMGKKYPSGRLETYWLQIKCNCFQLIWDTHITEPLHQFSFIRYTSWITEYSSLYICRLNNFSPLDIMELLLLRQRSFDSLNEWVQFVGFQKQHTPVWAHLHVVLHPVSDQTRVRVAFHTEFKLAVSFLYAQTHMSYAWECVTDIWRVISHVSTTTDSASKTFCLGSYKSCTATFL